MSFPLYRRPGGVVFLDDDRDYLEMLGEVMPPDWLVRLYLRPVACIERLQQDIALREADAWAQQEIVNRWREGSLLIPQILHYWRHDQAARFSLVQVAVVDYAMPAMSGLRMLAELTRWPGARILLTGRADEQLAVSAFNRGLISQFIPKQSSDIRQRLTHAIEALRHHPDERHQHIWRATFSPRQHALLSQPLIAQALEGLAQAQRWIEHVCIGSPFGVLALNAQGGISWLQLELAENLNELAEMALSEGFGERTANEIRSGSQLIDMELQLALGAARAPEARQAFVIAGESEPLYAAIFPVGESFGAGQGASHAQFLDSHGERDLPED